MTKNDIIAALTDSISEAADGVGMNEALDQSQLTAVTDAGANTLDTVNPNGPCYPSTPR